MEFTLQPNAAASSFLALAGIQATLTKFAKDRAENYRDELISIFGDADKMETYLSTHKGNIVIEDLLRSGEGLLGDALLEQKIAGDKEAGQLTALACESIAQGLVAGGTGIAKGVAMAKPSSAVKEAEAKKNICDANIKHVDTLIEKEEKKLKPVTATTTTNSTAVNTGLKNARAATPPANPAIPTDEQITEKLKNTKFETTGNRSTEQTAFEDHADTTEMKRFRDDLKKESDAQQKTLDKDPSERNNNVMFITSAEQSGTNLIAGGIKAATEPHLKKEQTEAALLQTLYTKMMEQVNQVMNNLLQLQNQYSQQAQQSTQMLVDLARSA